MHRFARLLPAALLVSGVFAVQPVSPVSVASAASTVTATYKIGSIETEAPPMGCVSGCPTVKTVTPAYTAQTSLGSTLSDATVVKTRTTWSGSGYTDSAGCAIVAGGGLKCWGDNGYGQLGDGTLTSSPSTPVTATLSGAPLTGVTDVSISERSTCVVISGAAKCVGAGFEDPANNNNWISKTEWTTVQPSDVSQVIVAATWGNYLTTPACVLTTGGKLRCGNIRSQSGWTEATYSGITDIELLGTSNTGVNVCIAGAQSLCLNYDSGTYTVSTTITNLTTSEAVYVQRDMNSALCFYSGDTMFCGPTSGAEVKMTAVGVMEKPKSIFATMSGMSKIYFVLSNGILYTEGWYFNCVGCATSTTIQVNAIGAFTASTSSSYNYAQSILAATTSPNIIPMSVETGSRGTRTLAPIKIVTSSGTPLAGTSIKWTAPDVPGTLGSSSSSTLQSDTDGAARSTLATGPVTFTLTNGTAANGAILQAASITVIVATSGTTTVTVPDAPTVISRTVTVLNADATPVPNASIALRNTFLTYAYQGSGAGTSTWASQARDTKGYFGQVTCVYCYVPAPTYMTGTNGSVTFKSFTPTSRSGTWDASINYDDGDLNQTVNANFTGASSSVTMPFMAKVEVAATDQDPATSTVEVPLDDSGTATVEVSLVDEAGTPVEGFTASTEDVCSEMESGGLASSTSKVTSVCSSVVATSAGNSRTAPAPVTSAGVRGTACNSVSSATTGKNGKAVFSFCTTSSRKFRIRGKGALASRTICVVVKGQPCGVSSTSSQTSSGSSGTSSGSKATVPVKSAKKGTIVAARKFLAPEKGATATYRASGTCSMRGTAVVMSKKSGWCALYMTQSKKTKVSGKWTVVKSKSVVRIRIT